MSKPNFSLPVLLPVSLPAALLAGLVGSSGARADDTVQAVWKAQELTYVYQGFTSKYTCDGLRDKVRAILVAVGAEPGLRVSSSGCIGNEPSPSPSVRIRLSTPVPATGKQADQFAATWKTVSLSARQVGTPRIESGDCELVEQLRDRVFPKIGVKVVKDDISCVPHQLNPGQPDLEVQALVAVKKADDKSGT